MSRSYKRDLADAMMCVDGRIPVIRKNRDAYVSHSKACYMCGCGTAPKRLMHIKPRRRHDKREAQRIIDDELLS